MIGTPCAPFAQPLHLVPALRTGLTQRLEQLVAHIRRDEVSNRPAAAFGLGRQKPLDLCGRDPGFDEGSQQLPHALAA